MILVQAKFPRTYRCYDDRGRLIDVDAGAATFTYNGQGQRVSKTSGTTTLFAYGEVGELLGEYDASGNAIQETVWFNGAPVALLDGTSTYYVHSDHLGTPRVISDGNTAIWRWESDPFGSTLPDEDPDNDGTTLTYNVRFPGQYYDAETGLHYNYFRTYDPSTGRYLESDPIGLVAGLNTYSYVSSVPTMRFDPYGLDWIEYTGEKATLYEGNAGDRSVKLLQCNATSGKRDFQKKNYVDKKNLGPVPEGKYKIDLSPDPTRQATEVDTVIVDGVQYRELASHPDGGIERIPPILEYMNAWGSWRARLSPIDNAPRHNRSNFYLHDSNKGDTSGCVETCTDFLGQFNYLRNQGIESIEVWIDYRDATTSGGRW